MLFDTLLTFGNMSFNGLLELKQSWIPRKRGANSFLKMVRFTHPSVFDINLHACKLPGLFLDIIFLDCVKSPSETVIGAF